MECIGEVARGFKGQEVLVSICVDRQEEAIFAISKHVLGVASSGTAGLGSEVQEDGIQFPPAQCLDGCLVKNTGDEQGDCTPRTEAVGFDSVRVMLVMCWTVAAAAHSCSCVIFLVVVVVVMWQSQFWWS